MLMGSTGGNYDYAATYGYAINIAQELHAIVYGIIKKNKPTDANDSTISSTDSTLSSVERLSQLYKDGILSHDEYQDKKAVLLSKIE